MLYLQGIKGLVRLCRTVRNALCFSASVLYLDASNTDSVIEIEQYRSATGKTRQPALKEAVCTTADSKLKHEP